MVSYLSDVDSSTALDMSSHTERDESWMNGESKNVFLISPTNKVFMAPALSPPCIKSPWPFKPDHVTSDGGPESQDENLKSLCGQGIITNEHLKGILINIAAKIKYPITLIEFPKEPVDEPDKNKTSKNNSILLKQLQENPVM